MPTHPAAPMPPFAPFIGHTAEGRALLLSVRAARSVVLVAPPAFGKSALLRKLQPAIAEVTVPLAVPKLAPVVPDPSLDAYRHAWEGRAVWAYRGLR